MVKIFQERSHALIRESRQGPPRGQSSEGPQARLMAVMGICGPIGISFHQCIDSPATMAGVELCQRTDEFLLSSYWTDRPFFVATTQLGDPKEVEAYSRDQVWVLRNDTTGTGEKKKHEPSARATSTTGRNPFMGCWEWHPEGLCIRRSS